MPSNLFPVVPISPFIDNRPPRPEWQNWFTSIFRFMNLAPQVSSGIVAPTTTPTKVGNIYVDTLARKMYIAVGTANSGDWEIVN